MEIEPATLWFAGRHSVHWDTPARAISLILLSRIRNRTLCSFLPTKNALAGFISPMFRENKNMRPSSECLRSSRPEPSPSQGLHLYFRCLTVILSTEPFQKLATPYACRKDEIKQSFLTLFLQQEWLRSCKNHSCTTVGLDRILSISLVDLSDEDHNWAKRWLIVLLLACKALYDNEKYVVCRSAFNYFYLEACQMK